MQNSTAGKETRSSNHRQNRVEQRQDVVAHLLEHHQGARLKIKSSPPQELVVPACNGVNSASIVNRAGWQALLDTQKVFDSMDAPAMIFTGTVLGLVRHCDPAVGNDAIGDLDFAVDRNWYRLNFKELAKKMESAGFRPKWYFPGAHIQRSFQSIPQKILNVKGFEVSWTHRNKMKIDLFGVTVTNATIEWGLWTSQGLLHNDCIAQATDVVPFTWHGLKVHVPVPVDAYLTSLYGKEYMKPANWMWDEEPFTIGSCTKAPKENIYHPESGTAGPESGTAGTLLFLCSMLLCVCVLRLLSGIAKWCMTCGTKSGLRTNGVAASPPTSMHHSFFGDSVQQDLGLTAGVSLTANE